MSMFCCPEEYFDEERIYAIASPRFSFRRMTRLPASTLLPFVAPRCAAAGQREDDTGADDVVSLHADVA